jgi:hypothetical protein
MESQLRGEWGVGRGHEQASYHTTPHAPHPTSHDEAGGADLHKDR